ncbi:hypothetical protein [Hymenobacter lucidus]|uniref:Succinate dehydrogenase n=1 Tax=Hymenobacter lucidus TaxID=2880930 RepID=A0ABS8AYM2_9BACT|nr:hypothetical protein [Hymenobacter lucidus]MCB2410873.1 hypothetical protein [Hymenobacter lucidus]
MHAPLTVPAGHLLVRWLAYALFQLALVLAFLLHSAAGLSSAFRRKKPELESVRATPRLVVPRHA